MRVLVAGHTYLRRFNQRKWEAFADLSPSHAVLLVVPNGWLDPQFGPVAPEPPAHPRVNLRVMRALVPRPGHADISRRPAACWRRRAASGRMIVLVEQEPHSLLALQGRWLARLLPGRPFVHVLHVGKRPRTTADGRFRSTFPANAARCAPLAWRSPVIRQPATSCARPGFGGSIERIPQVGVDLSDPTSAGREPVCESELGTLRRRGWVCRSVDPGEGRCLTWRMRWPALAGWTGRCWSIGRGPLRGALLDRLAASRLGQSAAASWRMPDHQRVATLLTDVGRAWSCRPTPRRIGPNSSGTC